MPLFGSAEERRIIVISSNHPTVLETRGTTTPLFNEVRVPDFVRVHAMSDSLDVEGFTEQSTGVSLSTAIADALEWAGISE